MGNFTHLGLFEGVGGFSLAARWMGWETLAWCEWDKFCQTVLKHHFPNAQSHGDIRTTDFTRYAGQIDILTGGFPCQPYSTAGKRLGKEDDRHLWPEMLRVIREVRPRYVVGEMLLASLVGMEGWYSTRCRLIWKLKGTKYGRLYFQLAPSTLPTDATGFGLLLTPRATTIEETQESFASRMNKHRKNDRKNGFPNLQAQVIALKLLPTPAAQDGKNATLPQSQALRDTVPGAVMRMLPTPKKQNANSPAEHGQGGMDLQTHIHKTFQPGGDSQLNPRFVAEMMGFPPDWLELPFQDTGENL